MTMVHIDTKAISRKAGQSAVACAAYRAGDVLDDAKYGKTHNYSKKRGVMSSDIVVPFALKALGAPVDRETLWNLAEAAENRSDSRVAREWLINLPYELSKEERHTLAIEFAQKLCDDMDVIADVCIHEPVMKLPFDPEAKPSSKHLREGEENPDPRNYHAHILVTTRAPQIRADKTLWFDSNFKVAFEWSNKKRKAKGLPSSMKEIKRIRQMWVNTANVILAKKKLPLMDARSYKDQGLDQQPTIKMGVKATAMERRGITTEKGDINRAIIARNERQQSLDERTITNRKNEQRAEYERRARELRDGLAWAAEQHDRLSQRIGDTKQRIDDSEQGLSEAEPEIDWSFEDCARATNRTYRAKQRIEAANDGAATAGDYAERLPRLIRDTAQRITDTEPDLAWTAKRCENLPNWIDGADKRNQKSQQRVDCSKHWIDFNSKRATDSESIAQDIHQSIAERAKPAPSPFDDAYQRAFYERKRRIDRKIGEHDRQAHRESYDDEKDNNDLKTTLNVFAHRLLARHNQKFSLRPGLRENPTDYPDKFDYRQVAILDRFANELGLSDRSNDFRDEQRRVADLFTPDVMQNNAKAMAVLINNKKERANYNEVTADFDDFITQLNTDRAAENIELQAVLGHSGTSKMTAETLTAVSHLRRLEAYINNSDTADDCKALAHEHFEEALRRNSATYKYAYQGLKDLTTTDSIRMHTEALEGSLRVFNKEYGHKLSKEHQNDINEGLKALNQQSGNTQNNIPRLTPR